MPSAFASLAASSSETCAVKPERQHHAANLIGAERIDRDRRTQRGIDAAGNAEQHAGKAVLADVVAQAQHAGRVIALVALDQRHHGPGAAPAVGALGPAQRDDALLEGGQLRRDRKIGVERERRTIEHQFVLSADLVEIDQRQAALGNTGNCDRQPQIVLVARIGRAVRHHQNFSAGLGEALDDVLVFLDFSSQMSSQMGTPTRTPRTVTGPAAGPRANRRFSSNTP